MLLRSDQQNVNLSESRLIVNWPKNLERQNDGSIVRQWAKYAMFIAISRQLELIFAGFKRLFAYKNAALRALR